MSQVVSTKISRPGTPAYGLTRPRLLERLARSLAASRSTLLRAPAGYGKSTLCAQFLSDRPEPVVWFSCDHFDTAPVVAAHLCAAATAADPGAHPMGSHLDFIAWLSRRTEPLILVLDDFHLLADREARALIGDVLRRAAEAVHVIICTRQAFPHSPALSPDGQVLELGIRDLAFSQDEMAELVLGMNPGLEKAALDRLWSWSEGWPSAVMLLAQTLQRGESLPSDRRPGPGPVDYLLLEFTDSYPPAVYGCLLTLSAVEQFCPELCACLCGSSLPWNWRESWFVLEVEDRAGWYRFHPLVAQFLRHQARSSWPNDRLEEVHRRASAWLEARGHLDEAICQALLGQEWSRVGRCLSERKSLAELLNFYRRSAEWFQALPEQEIDHVLSSRLGIVLWSALRYQEAYQAFERGLGSGVEEVEFLCLAGLTSCCDAMALNQKRGEWYLRALAAVPRPTSRERTVGLHLLATVAVISLGNAKLGQHFTENGEMAQTLPDSELPLFFEGLPGTISLLRGSLTEAARKYEDWRARCALLGHDGLERIAWAMLGCARYELGMLEAAYSCWQRYFQGDSLAYVAPVKVYVWPRYIGTLRGLGKLEEAQEAFATRSRFELERCGDLELSRVRLSLEEGRSDEAAALLGDPPADPDPTDYNFGQQARYWSFIALWSTRDDARDHARAERWLEVIEGQAELAERTRDRLEVALARVYLRLRAGDQAEAAALLRGPLRAGRGLGYVAVFMEQPPEIRRLCLEQDPSLGKAGSEWRLSSLLSEREQEILSLIQSGASNRQIAERCYLSLNTVKWYAQRIYKKLGVSGRSDVLRLEGDGLTNPTAG